MSVIMVVRNGAATISRQLVALAAQEAAPSFEVVVVDNESSDDTADLVRAWLAGPGGAPCGAVLIDGSARTGIPFARNLGAMAARGQIFASCDADDVAAPGWLAALVAGMGEHVAVGGALDAVDRWGRPDPEKTRHALGRTRYAPFAPTNNMAVTREAFFAIGGFDESLPRYGLEDVDFSFRLYQAGHRLAFAPGALMTVTSSSATARARKVYQASQGRMLMARRYPEWDPTPYSFGYCVVQLLALALFTPVRLVRTKGSALREFTVVLEAAGRLRGYLRYWRGPVPARQTQHVIAS